MATLELVVKGVDHASGVFKDIDGHASRLGGTMGTVLKAGALGAAAGIGVAAFAAVDFIKQAAEEEAGIKRLAAAVDANGGSWARQGAEIEKIIQGRQKLAFSDDELRSSLAMLTAQTGDADEAMRRQLVAMDLARGANIDLGSASKLLGKVTDESHGALSRLGIVVDKNADSAEVLAAVQQRFGGQSAAFADSAAGKWARVNIAFDNIKETIGAALLPVVTKLADKLAKFLEENQDDIERFVETFQEWATEALPKVEAFVNSNVIPTLESAFAQLKQTIEALSPIVAEVVDFLTEHKEIALALGIALGVLVAAFAGPLLAIPALIILGTLLLANWDAIRDKAEELYATVKEKIEGIIAAVQEIPILGAIFTDTFNTIWTIVTTYFELIKVAFSLALDTIKNTFTFWKAIFSGDWDAAWGAVKDQFKAIVDALAGVLGIAIDAVKTLVDSKLTMIGDIGKSIGSAIWEGIKGAVGAGSDLGTAFVDGIIGMINWIIRQINDAIPDKISIPLGPDISLPNIPEISPPAQGGTGSPYDMPQMQRGGIIPAGVTMQAMLHGPEAVIPLKDGLMQPIEVHIHSLINTSSAAELEEAAEIIDNLLQRRRRY